MEEAVLRLIGRRLMAKGLHQSLPDVQLTQVLTVAEIDGISSYISATVDRERKLYDELVRRCNVLPTYDRVALFMGRSEADTFMVHLEKFEQTHGTTANGTLTESSTRALCKFVRWACERNVRAYDEYRRAENRVKRQGLSERNRILQRRAQDLCIWFPYADQLEQWRKDHERFAVLVETVKVRMKTAHKGMLQYVQKRKFTVQSLDDLPMNMENMQRYLMST